MKIKLSENREYRLSFEYETRATLFYDQAGNGYNHPEVIVTIARLGNDNTCQIVAEAYCSESDRFVKSIGRDIAVRRLIASLNKDDRAAVGKAWFGRERKSKS